MMPGLSLGFFSPSHEIGDIAVVADRIREICGPVSVAFPMIRSPLKIEDGSTGLFYTVLKGHVPIHYERRDAANCCPSMFTFVIEAEDRPVLLYSPTGQQEARCILQPEEAIGDPRAMKMAFGAVEMIEGRAFHYDVSSAFVGMTSFPTGDPEPTLPSAVLIQVPWARADDIGGALYAMKRMIWADPRFQDLVAARAN